MIGKHPKNIGFPSHHGELWKPISFSKRYYISDFGRVYSSIRKGRILKPTIGSHGYEYVSIMVDGKPKKMLVHRLVGEHHLDGMDQTINHIDGNKLNNHKSNLEWVSHGQNIRHAMDNGLNNCHCEFHYASKLTNSDVCEILKRASKGESHASISKDFPVVRQTISKIASRSAWRKHNGA